MTKSGRNYERVRRECISRLKANAALSDELKRTRQERIALINSIQVRQRLMTPKASQQNTVSGLIQI